VYHVAEGLWFDEIVELVFFLWMCWWRGYFADKVADNSCILICFNFVIGIARLWLTRVLCVKEVQWSYQFGQLERKKKYYLWDNITYIISCTKKNVACFFTNESFLQMTHKTTTEKYHVMRNLRRQPTAWEEEEAYERYHVPAEQS